MQFTARPGCVDNEDINPRCRQASKGFTAGQNDITTRDATRDNMYTTAALAARKKADEARAVTALYEQQLGRKLSPDELGTLIGTIKTVVFDQSLLWAERTQGRHSAKPR